MEGLSGVICWHFHDPLGGPGGCDTAITPGWHTFASDWQPGSVTYYYDGQDVGSITYRYHQCSDVHHPQQRRSGWCFQHPGCVAADPVRPRLAVAREFRTEDGLAGTPARPFSALGPAQPALHTSATTEESSVKCALRRYLTVRLHKKQASRATRTFYRSPRVMLRPQISWRSLLSARAATFFGATLMVSAVCALSAGGAGATESRSSARASAHAATTGPLGIPGSWQMVSERTVHGFHA